MTAILYRALAGVAGDVSRPDNTVVESALLNSAKVPSAFGAPVKMNSGVLEKIEAGDTSEDFYGVLTRIAPSIAGDTAQTFESGTPNADAVQGVAVSGYVSVVCAIGTPVRNGDVHMRVVADTGKAIGDFEATSDVSAIGAADGGNTGNGTIGTLSATQDAQEGVYTATMTAATAFQVVAPDGTQLKAGATGAAYTADGVTFTITVGGTPMVAGDFFTITVAKNNVALPGVVWAVDGKDADGNTELRIK